MYVIYFDRLCFCMLEEANPIVDSMLLHFQLTDSVWMVPGTWAAA